MRKKDLRPKKKKKLPLDVYYKKWKFFNVKLKDNNW